MNTSQRKALARNTITGLGSLVSSFKELGIDVYEFSLGAELKDGYSWPAVAFKADQDFKQLEEIADRTSIILDGQTYKNNQEKQELEEENERVYQEARIANVPARVKVLELLEEFYKDRNIEYGTELIVTNYDFAYAMIQNANEETFYQLPKEKQAEIYKKCCQEFLDFTEFVKHKTP